MNKHLLLLSVILYLHITCSYCNQPQVCYGRNDQQYNIINYLDSSKISNGIININSYNYDWDAQLPIPDPKNNIYLRFQYKKSSSHSYYDFFQRYDSNNGLNYIFLSMSSSSLYFDVYNDNDSTRINFPNFSSYFSQFDDYTWLGLFVTQDKIQLYFQNKLVATVSQQGNTLKYFSGVQYHLNSRVNDPTGQIKNLQVYHDLSTQQFDCLKSQVNMVICPQNQVFNNGQCYEKECTKKASSLYEVQLDGEGTYNYSDHTYTFTLTAQDLYIPNCVNGYILDGEGNEINFSGSLINPTFTFDQQQIADNCYLENGKQSCEFLYILQVQDSIKVVFNVKSTLQDLEAITNSVEFKGKLTQTQSRLNQVQKLEDAFDGLVLHRNYNLEAQYLIQSNLVFYSSFTFKYPLRGHPYSYGSDIYAQVQVDQGLLAAGYKLEFVSAKITGQNINLSVIPTHIDYSDEGYLNLTFRTEDDLLSVEIDLLVNYQISNQNWSLQYQDFKSVSKTIQPIQQESQKSFLSEQPRNKQNIIDHILAYFH